MSSRPGACSRTSTGHRRIDSGHHQRHNSSSSGHQQSDSGQSFDSDCYQQQQQKRQHLGHHRSKSGVNEHESNGSQLSSKVEFRSSQTLQQQQQHYNRPTTLYPLKNDGITSDGLQPEREPIRFDVNLVGAPPEVEQLVNNIKQVAESFLYHWKTFPIILPTPVSQYESFPTSQYASDGSLGRCKTKYHLKDLFITPSFDELDAVAVDSKGEPRRLTGKQLEYIRERGEFEVDSLNFPGQKHRWRLSQLLQKGVENSHESLLNDMALALRFIFITAKGRLLSHFFSISQSIKSLLDGFLLIIDILIGIPSLQVHNLDAKIREERTKYLVAELICRPENEESVEHLCSYIRKQLRRATMEKFEVTKECSQPPVAVPYRFRTPSGIDLDLRLFERNLIRKIIPIVISILEREQRGWFLHFRERLIAELRTEKLPDDLIQRQVNDAVMKEYLQRVFNSILTNADIQNLGDGIAQLLVQQAQSVVLMHRAVENVQYRLSKSQEDIRTRLCTSYPVLSRIEPWLRSKLRQAEYKFSQENQWSAHEEALTLCNSQKLSQTVYFLNRDVAFMREREPALLRELGKVKTPTRSFLWPTQIWLPTNWIVRRNFQGQSEIVPTVLSKHATSITTPRSDPSQPVFLCEKEIVRTTTTRWPLWRIFNYCHRTWCWTWNAMFFFGIILPWCSPLGLRALLSIEPFMPDLELSQLNGTLFPRKSSVTLTLCSRLLKLWRHISKSRTHFETKPDTGFIGKGFTRHLNRLWNYFVKGLFGTLLLIIIFPMVCVCVIIISLLIALTAIVWMPILTLFLQITNAFVYDLDCPDLKRNRYFVIFEALLWQILLQGCLQPILSVFISIFVCPTIALLILTGGLLRYWLRLLWDTTIFHLIIKKRGRIPASDSFVVKRIAGPGLTNDYYFQISPEQALAALEAKIEWDELVAYQQIIENLIVQPQRDFSHFIEACFGSFSTQLSKNGGQYKVLEKESQDLLSVLYEKLERRRRDLQTGLNITIKSKIKLETEELKIAIQQGALMLERYYYKHVIEKLDLTNDDEFWETRGLFLNDWANLAGLLYTEIFSLDILTPLDHCDTSFRLESNPNIDLQRYTEMVQTAQFGANRPDLLGNVYTPRGNIQVHSPCLDVSVFNPRSKQANTAKKSDRKTETSSSVLDSLRKNNNSTSLRMPWKRYQHPYTPDKLVIPLPIPHPAHIAVTIYNRDSDDPIPLESEICQSILKGIEESHLTSTMDDHNGGIGRYKGGGGGGGDSFETSSSCETVDENSPISQEQQQQQQQQPEVETTTSDGGVYHWTLNNWGQRKRNNSGSVRVDLASPEDVTLDSDSTRVVFSTYGTTV